VASASFSTNQIAGSMHDYKINIINAWKDIHVKVGRYFQQRILFPNDLNWDNIEED
jgi:hypothetical protein